jgi:hypothetical protein
VATASWLDQFRALLRSPTSVLADVSHDPAGAERLLVRGDATGTMQLWRRSRNPPQG